jgi:hypothetical protein
LLMKPVVLAGVAALALSIAGAAQAEKWVYYPVPGGALAYEDDGRKSDIASGLYGGDTLIFYFVPKALGAKAYSEVIQRMEFECRGTRYKIPGTAYFDEKGQPLSQLEASGWMPVPAGAATIFRHIFCTNDRPPTAKDVPSLEALLAALQALPPTSTRSKATLPLEPLILTPGAAK